MESFHADNVPQQSCFDLSFQKGLFDISHELKAKWAIYPYNIENEHIIILWKINSNLFSYILKNETK